MVARCERRRKRVRIDIHAEANDEISARSSVTRRKGAIEFAVQGIAGQIDEVSSARQSGQQGQQVRVFGESDLV